MTKDEEHLNLLTVFHYVVGGLVMLFSSFFLIHVGMGLGIVSGSFPLEAGKAKPDPFGWIFVAMGSAVVLLGWTLGILIVVAGRKLRARRSRTFCIVIAALECLAQPLGTVLGVFTIIVLLRPSVIALFEGTAPATPQPPPAPTQY